MRIHHFIYPVNDLLGPGCRAVLWTAGCSKRCAHCITPELQDKNSGVDIDVHTLFEHIKPNISSNCEGFTISGGEPFEQPELCEFISLLRTQAGVKDVLVYSGYQLKELPPNNLRGITALIDGGYIHSKNTNGEKPWGSANQKLHVFDPTFEPTYVDWAKNYSPRLQNFYTPNGVYCVGMHPAITTDD